MYRRKPPAVSIGRYQKIEDVVNVEYCRKRGIDIIRRISGGGTIYTDSNCLEYSIIVDQRHPKIPKDLEGSFRVICTGIVIALKRLNIDASYKPVNDVLVKGRKISGNAQRRRRVLLQHGTILLDADFELMSKTLRVGDDGKLKLIEKLTTIKREADRMIDVKDVTDVLKISFEEVLSMKLVKGMLTVGEDRRVKELTDKYRSRSWILSA